MTRVLISRPAEAAARTAATIRRLGFEPVVAPVVEIVAQDLTPDARHDECQAVLVTSRHAAQAAASIAAGRSVFAVGAGTARALEDQGVCVAGVAEGDGRSLAALVAAHLDPSAGALLHPTGAARARGLAEGLAAAGFVYRPWVVYAAEPVMRLPDVARAGLVAGTIDLALIYSPRSGRLLLERIAEAGLSRRLATVDALAISAATAAAVAGAPWRSLRTASRSDETGMVGLLEAARH